MAIVEKRCVKTVGELKYSYHGQMAGLPSVHAPLYLYDNT